MLNFAKGTIIRNILHISFVLILLVIISPVQAADLSRVEFGKLMLREEIVKIPVWARNVDCSEYDYLSCTFTDEKNIEYGIDDGVVVSKQVSVSSSSIYLPYGITSNDGINTCINKVFSRLGLTLRPNRYRDDAQIYYTEDYSGHATALLFIFDLNGKLETIMLQYESV